MSIESSMILSFTKKMAAIFNLELQASKSEVFAVTPILDDWVMSSLWTYEDNVGVALIHTHSLFTVTAVSENRDFLYCIDLCYEQLLNLLEEMNLNKEPYLKFFTNLFHNINAIKNDDKSIIQHIKSIYKKLEELEEKARENGDKIHSIEISRAVNNMPRQSLNNLTANEVFARLLKNHHNDSPLELHSAVSFKQTSTTVH